jgi:ribonuclease D
MNVETPALPALIQSRGDLSELAQDLRRQTRIAVDTESNSLHAYRERVCLIQFSTADRDCVVDPLAFDELDVLAGIFANPLIEKVFHASEYDVVCLRRDFGFSFNTIFDTMQAGRILGRKQAGLDRLLEEKFGIATNKRFQKADWGVRPLGRDLLLYAALDTHYLLALRDLLAAELHAKGLWELAQDDFRMACHAREQRPRTESPAWTRFRTRRDIAPRDLTILRELIACREAIAARLDRPPFKVLEDYRLLELARARPATTQELESLGLAARQMELAGTDVLAAVATGLESPLVENLPRRTSSEPHLKRLEKLKEWRKKAAAEMDVESDVILPRGMLLALAENGKQAVAGILESSPWRLARFGDQISALLQALPS